MLSLTKGDKLVVLFVICAAMLSYMVFTVAASTEASRLVEIYVDGRLYAEYSLADISGEKLIEINSKYGHNTLRLTSEGAEMTDSSCPDKRDIKSGRITKPGHIIICVPNRVSVKLLGDTKTRVDKVTY